MTTNIKHPAYHEDVQRGVPSRASIGSETYEVDDDGYLAVDDESEAVAAMQRLAETYSVEYDDDGEIVDVNAPVDTSVEDTDTGGASAARESDDGEEPPDEASAHRSREDLKERDHEELKDLFRDLGGDTDAMDMRSKDEVIAGILRLDADGVRAESAADSQTDTESPPREDTADAGDRDADGERLAQATADAVDEREAESDEGGDEA